MNKLEEIKKLKALLDQRAITTEEFNELKKDLLKETAAPPKSEQPAAPPAPPVSQSKETKGPAPKATRNNAAKVKSKSKHRTRNWILGLATVTIIILLVLPTGKDSSSPDSSQQEETQQDDDALFVRNYIISHTFYDIENGTAFSIEFTDSRGGWFGVMTMKMGDCWFLYRYETSERNIKLDFDSSNCTTEGSSTTARFNRDNTISIYVRGQEFIFEPL